MTFHGIDAIDTTQSYQRFQRHKRCNSSFNFKIYKNVGKQICRTRILLLPGLSQRRPISKGPTIIKTLKTFLPPVKILLLKIFLLKTWTQKEGKLQKHLSCCFCFLSHKLFLFPSLQFYFLPRFEPPTPHCLITERRDNIESDKRKSRMTNWPQLRVTD